MLRCAFIFAVFFSMPGFAYNDDTQSSYTTEVLGACKAEVEDHCHGKNLKPGDITACLKAKSHDQKNKFTESCRDTLAKKK